MAIVEVRIEGLLEDRPKQEKPELPKPVSSEEDTEQTLNNETEEFLKEAKRRVSALSQNTRAQKLLYLNPSLKSVLN